jgi:hypothetical protein
VQFSGTSIRDQQVGIGQNGEPLYRKPIFDIDVKAQRRNPWSTMAQNELAKELLAMGAFNPERAQEMLGALKLMEFEGKEEVVEYVQQGQTLLNILQQMTMELNAMKMAMGMVTAPAGSPAQSGGSSTIPSSPITDGIMQAQAPRAPYAERLAQRSTPKV